MEILGTKQMIVSFLNSLLYLFKEGRFGKIKNKKSNTNEKMNNNNRIRLTESQLRNVIKESVKQILSELDWKTQQWAADERERRNNDVMRNGQKSQYFNKYQQQGLANGSKYGDFATLQGKAYQQQRNNQQAAKQQFNQDYGYNERNMNPTNGQYNNVNIGLNYDGTGVMGTQSSGNLQKGASAQTTQSSSYGKNGDKASIYNDTSIQGGYNKPQFQGSSMVTANKNGVTTTQNGDQTVNNIQRNAFNRTYGDQFRKADDEVAAYRGGKYQYQKGRGWQQQ